MEGTPARIIGALSSLITVPCLLVAAILNTKKSPIVVPEGKVVQINESRVGSLLFRGFTSSNYEVPVPSWSLKISKS